MERQGLTTSTCARSNSALADSTASNWNPVLQTCQMTLVPDTGGAASYSP